MQQLKFKPSVWSSQLGVLQGVLFVFWSVACSQEAALSEQVGATTVCNTDRGFQQLLWSGGTLDGRMLSFEELIDYEPTVVDTASDLPPHIRRVRWAHGIEGLFIGESSTGHSLKSLYQCDNFYMLDKLVLRFGVTPGCFAVHPGTYVNPDLQKGIIVKALDADFAGDDGFVERLKAVDTTSRQLVAAFQYLIGIVDGSPKTRQIYIPAKSNTSQANTFIKLSITLPVSAYNNVAVLNFTDKPLAIAHDNVYSDFRFATQVFKYVANSDLVDDFEGQPITHVVREKLRQVTQLLSTAQGASLLGFILQDMADSHDKALYMDSVVETHGAIIAPDLVHILTNPTLRLGHLQDAVLTRLNTLQSGTFPRLAWP